MLFVFDVDDTLYNLMTSFERVHEELFKNRTEVSCEKIFEASRRYNSEAFDLWNKGLISKTEEFDYRIRKAYGHYQVDLNAMELEEFRLRYRRYQDEISMNTVMEDLLRQLKDHQIPMAILTNGNHQDQWKKIKALGVERFVPKEYIFVSEDLPAPKPSRLAFDTVRQAFSMDPDQCFYVGDTFEVDMVGAQKGGWHSIWFNHRKKALPNGCRPADYEVVTPEELTRVVLACANVR